MVQGRRKKKGRRREEEERRKKRRGKERRRPEPLHMGRPEPPPMEGAGASRLTWPVPPPGGGHARERPGRYYRPCLAGTTGQRLGGTSWPREKKGGRYPWPEAPAKVPLGVPGPQYLAMQLPGTSGGTSGRGTAQRSQHPGLQLASSMHFRYHGRYLRSGYRPHAK